MDDFQGDDRRSGAITTSDGWTFRYEASLCTSCRNIVARHTSSGQSQCIPESLSCSDRGPLATVDSSAIGYIHILSTVLEVTDRREPLQTWCYQSRYYACQSFTSKTENTGGTPWCTRSRHNKGGQFVTLDVRAFTNTHYNSCRRRPRCICVLPFCDLITYPPWPSLPQSSQLSMSSISMPLLFAFPSSSSNAIWISTTRSRASTSNFPPR